MDVHEVVGALKYLETRKGTHPSTIELSEYLGCAQATAIKYLQRAVGEGLITQREGHYMTQGVARAFDLSEGGDKKK